MNTVQWKEYADGPTKRKSEVSMVHCHSSGVDCYIDKKENGPWRWSVYVTKTDKLPEVAIDGTSPSLDDAKLKASHMIHALQDFVQKFV